MRMPILTSPRFVLAVVMLISAGPIRATMATEPAVSFQRDVRPILSAHCFKCHGPDDQTREAGVRFDVRESAIAESESGSHPIVPGKPSESALVERIFADDESTVMPPPATNKPLSQKQKETLRAWIASGAEYESHWAFSAIVAATPPAVKHASWPRGAIDHFVLARMEAAGLTPAPEADRHTLVRRVYLDLVGLPPTPAEVAAFVDDSSSDAYEKLVDRLLDSPHYGERWARRWLDLARYADTNGYEKDRVRSIWPYRDWVINALNADMPFDQFTIEQLAGDMLPEATPAQLVATGFHRNTMLNEEGGVDPLEFRHYAVVDRVNTTGTVWLGLTIGCAQCHTHKYDPLTHRDYYQFMALLNNADEPELDVPQPGITVERERLLAEIATLEADLPNRFPPPEEFRWQVPTIVKVESAAGANAEVSEDGAVRLTGNVPQADDYTVVVDTELSNIAALELVALPHDELPSKGPGRAPNGNFVLTELSLTAASAAGNDEPRPVAIASATADFAQEGFPVAAALDGDDRTGWAIDGPQPWNVERTAVFRLAEPLPTTGDTRLTIRLGQQYGGQHLLGRFRVRLGEARSDHRPLAEQRAEHLQQKFDAWLTSASADARNWTLLKPTQATSIVPTLTMLDDGSIIASGDQTKSDTYQVSLENPLPRVTAIRLEVLPDESLPRRGPGRIAYEGPFGDFFLSEVSLRSGDTLAKLASASHSFAAGAHVAGRAIDGDQQTGWSIDGGQGRAHTAVFVLAEPLENATSLDLSLLFERYYACGIGRFKVWATDESRPVTALPLSTEIERMLLVDKSQHTPEQREQLLSYFVSIAPELAADREKIADIRKQVPEYPRTLVFRERTPEHPRQTFVHHRGEFTQPKDAVDAQLPSMFEPFGPGEPANRLALARWLVSERNPLVGRVTVNRLWAALFGKGIVRTTEDFGFQGSPPSHPELLDYLAVEFRRQGWSQKQLLKMIVTSATYRQSSRVTPEALLADPQNDWLARFPRVRLEAELVRDAALQIGGLLTEKLGGPSVFPPQPASVTSEGAYGALSWTVSEGADRYRRGLYTFSKRTAPYAMFLTFDAPSGEACIPRREVSNTPLQALTLLNDGVFVEVAQALGRSLAAEASSPEQGLDSLFTRCLARPPSPQERELFLAAQAQFRQRLAAGAIDAQAIAGPGETDVKERALWTLSARALLNLDETFTKE